MTDKVRSTFSERLKAFLVLRRETPVTIAEKSGVSLPSVYRFTNEECTAGSKYVWMLAKALDCKVSDLIEGKYMQRPKASPTKLEPLIDKDQVTIEVNECFSQRLKAFMTVKRETPVSIAEKCGLSHPTVYRIVNGQGNTRGRTVWALANALKCRVSELVN